MIHQPAMLEDSRVIIYSFDVEDEYVAIKEHEHSDHSKTNIDTCQAYRERFRIMDEGWLDLAVKKLTIWYTLKKTCVEEHSDTLSTHFCSRTQIGESSRATYHGSSSF
ncbi:hypothetical protein Tco_0506414 [Tanacetum coccineum]